MGFVHRPSSMSGDWEESWLEDVRAIQTFIWPGGFECELQGAANYRWYLAASPFPFSSWIPRSLSALYVLISLRAKQNHSHLEALSEYSGGGFK
jgi:hypothetical protein